MPDRSPPAPKAAALARRPPSRAAAQRLVSDLRGASRLAIDGVLGVTALVENLHRNIQHLPAPLGQAREDRTRGLTGLVYRSIGGVTRLVGGTLEGVLGRLAALLGSADTAPPSAQRDALVAALNGVLGDHLAATHNPLALPMRLLHDDGRPLALEAPPGADPSAWRPRVLLLLHGLCMHPGQWARNGFDYGPALAAETGSTLLHLHYNTGLHVAANGQALAQQLQALVQRWPVPLQGLDIVGHSMGGLVARSALHQAAAAGMDWPQHVQRLVCLGTPHHGAPLERGGHGVDLLLAASPYTSALGRLGRVRSAGITDLRHGSLLDEDRSGPRFARGRDTRVPVPLPAGVACHALAGLLATPVGRRGYRWLGDGLVPLDSALGRHAQPARCLHFAPGHTRIVEGVGHLDLMGHAEVLEQLRAWLQAPPVGA